MVDKFWQPLDPKEACAQIFGVFEKAGWNTLIRYFPQRTFPVGEDGWEYLLHPLGITYSVSETRVANIAMGAGGVRTRMLAEDNRGTFLREITIHEQLSQTAWSFILAESQKVAKKIRA